MFSSNVIQALGDNIYQLNSGCQD